MIVSNDSIMKSPYKITNKILELLTSIAEKLGEINSAHLNKPAPELRKRNRVKTIKASLAIEGNTLTEDQITALIENKRVIGPEKDINEVINAISVYEKLADFNANSLNSFLNAHKMLMKGLVESPGKLRSKSVGIVKGNMVAHVAPPAENLAYLMKDLFKYLKSSYDHTLIKSCVVHYEIEFIHPFIDGNGRMGRLWQTLILMKKYPVFEYIPFETIIKDRQKEYYYVLEASDKKGNSTLFIEFILLSLNDALFSLLNFQNRIVSTEQRVDYFLATYIGDFFTRKDYMNIFKDISAPTASRDLKYALNQKLIQKEGDKRTAKYRLVTK